MITSTQKAPQSARTREQASEWKRRIFRGDCRVLSARVCTQHTPAHRERPRLHSCSVALRILDLLSRQAGDCLCPESPRRGCRASRKALRPPPRQRRRHRSARKQGR
eukprot:1276245-Pleurochrysis_carterae.AAC.1